MSHPDPCYDPDNSLEDDMNYDDTDVADDLVYGDIDADELENSWDDEGEDDYYDDSMDGDFDSAMRDAGFGTDEDYGCYGGEDY